jgi:GntR family transcriptional regulator
MTTPDEQAPAEARRRRVDRASPLPYYHQLKEIILADIADRRLQPGDRLPGDHELCERYGLSRTVVRQALADLQNEGVVERVKGRGTYVAPQRTSQGLVQSLSGLYDDVAGLGRVLRSDVRTLKVTAADGEVAGRLHLATGDPDVLLERLRYVDDEPWVYAISHVPEVLAPDLVEQDLREQSLYALLENRYGILIARSQRIVEAHGATGRLAKDLQIPKHAPVLKLTNVSFDTAGTPVETFVAYHRADRSRFEVTLERARGGQPVQPLVRPL